MRRKKILIFDEPSFARVCSALLEDAGYKTQTISTADEVMSVPDIGKFSLVITSYPLCIPIVTKIRQLGIPSIVLSDDIDEDLFNILKDLRHSYCMMKPLDYKKFRYYVRQTMSRDKTSPGETHYYV